MQRLEYVVFCADVNNGEDVVEARTAFVRGVDALLAEGWRPQGGVSVVYARSGNLYHYSQALVREVSDDVEP